MACSSAQQRDTLKELAAEKKYLGAETGSICILHTWGSEMNFHPHLHTILLGGGLNRNNRWVDNGKEFFLPIRVISRTFRGKYLAGVKQLWKDGRLEFHGTAKKYREPLRISVSDRSVLCEGMGSLLQKRLSTAPGL